MARRMSFVCYLIATVFFSANFAEYAAQDAQVDDELTKKIDGSDTKLKRQNDGGGGEEVDLAGIPDAGQPNQPGQGGVGGAQPGGNGLFGQQPFFNNGFGFPGGQGGLFGGQGGIFNGQGNFPGQGAFQGAQGGFPAGQGGFQAGQGGFPAGQGGIFGGQGGFPGSFAQGIPQNGFAQGFPQGGFQNGYPQIGGAGRNVILQNNGKQYLVQPLTANQRVVQKNGKQYLLQPLTDNTNAALTNGVNGLNGVGGIPTFNVPNSALAGLTAPFGQQNAALQSINPGFSAGNAAFNLGGGTLGAPGPNAAYSTAPGLAGPNAAYPPYAPQPAGGQPSASNSAKLTSPAPQRVVVNSNGQRFEVEQIPIRTGQVSPFLSTAIGAVSAQLAAQGTGKQYAYQYVPLNAGLAAAYSRANQAGYGLFNTGRGDVGSNGPAPIKR